MATLKLDKAQYMLLMNDPLHYDVQMRCNSVKLTWECTCDPSTAAKIKKIIDN